MILKIISYALVLGAVAATPGRAQAPKPPVDFGSQESTGADRQAIETLLNSYTSAVTAGDEKRFEALLLSADIPFSGVGTQTVATHFNPRNFTDFRRQIFDSGVRYTQSFYDVQIHQDGVLAQVSLDFVTREATTGRGGWGWKTLQLLKVGGQWKIASEFYTGHPLPKS